MQYIDPFPALCEFCHTKSNYAVKDLLAYKAKCIQCGKVLEKTASGMHESEKKHRVETWPMHFIFDGIEAFNIDIDDLSDEEFEAIKTIQDFVQLVEKIKGENITNKIQSMKMIQPLLHQIELNKLLQYQLEELALLANNT